MWSRLTSVNTQQSCCSSFMSYKLFQFCIINIITIIIDYFGSIGTEDNDIIHQRQKVIDHMFGGRKLRSHRSEDL
ncbi:hypothetical protein F2P81_015831 [Scophthalmus maximus]|uniref:Uncharacterized protein n=1 Tax=Scophthalmus maximus TaxID=52904 RepID=A0A6A4S7U0_SCOMX|nr:hypothetical protein F2P81_015831 [Scophthalmus maximus]